MIRMTAPVLAMLSMLTMSCANPHAQTSSNSVPARESTAANPFVGVWRLVSIERPKADGSMVPGVNPVGGLDPIGIVMYDAAGHVSLQIMPRGRTKTIDTLQPLTPDQAQEAFFGAVIYYGTYTLDQAKRIMTINFDGALNPRMIGTTGQRYYEISGNRMTFRPSLTDGANLLTWERIG